MKNNYYSLFCFLYLSTLSIIYAQPINDNPCSAIDLTVGTSCSFTTYTNAAATASAGVPAPGCASYSGGDVWFKFTVPASGKVTVNTTPGVMTDSGMAWYTGTCGSLSIMASGCNDMSSETGINMSKMYKSGLTPGDVIWVRIWEFGNNNNGTFGICASEPPTNDNCAGATAFGPILNDGSCTYLNNQSTNYSTNSSVTPTGACTSNSGTPDDDVWFSFVAPAATVGLNSTTVSGNTNLEWQVFSSACAGSMTSVMCTGNDSGGLINGLTAGNTYYIRLYTNGSGNTVVTTQNICLRVPPPNDNCANATPFGAISNDGSCTYLYGKSTMFATNSGVTPTGACVSNTGTPDDDVWFKFVAPGPTAILTGTSISGDPNVVWQVFSGACAGSMTSVFCSDNDGGGNLTGLTTGNTYYLRLYTNNNLVNTTKDICLRTPPINDECANAIAFPPIPVDGVTCSSLLQQTTQFTTNSNVTPTGACTSNTGFPDDDVWFKFVANGPTAIISSTLVSGASDVYWEVFSGACAGTMTSVRCSDLDPGGQNINITDLTSGNTYYIRLYTLQTGVNTTLDICLKRPIPICYVAQPFCSDNTYNFENSVNTYAQAGVDYGCLGSKPNPAWYYMRIGTAGTLQLTMSQEDNMGAGLDVDFCMWGPFPSLGNACLSIENKVPPIQSSYDDDPAEIAALGVVGGNDNMCSGAPPVAGEGVSTPPAAQVGEYYMIVLTNYANDPGYITFAQTGGTGATDCSIVLGSDFVYFEGENRAVNDNYLYWKIQENKELARFKIERRSETSDWKTIDIVQANNENNSLYTYTYSDDDYEDILNYYRIIQVDFDGSTVVSPSIVIDNTLKSKSIDKIVNILGQEIDENQKGLNFIIYSDGTIVKNFK